MPARGPQAPTAASVRPVDVTEQFRLWWTTTATADDQARLRAIVEGGDRLVDGKLLKTLTRAGVPLVGARWESSDEGFDFYLTPAMCDIILDRTDPGGR
jgi:hypothetical protein